MECIVFVIVKSLVSKSNRDRGISLGLSLKSVNTFFNSSICLEKLLAVDLGIKSIFILNRITIPALDLMPFSKLCYLLGI